MGTILTLIVAFVAARECLQVKVTLRPCNIANKMANVKRTTVGIIDEIRFHLISRSEREQARARRKAQLMYDATVGQIFANATDEEKQTLLDLFQKYSVPEGYVVAEGS